jgi:hypothetical protein
MDGGAPRWPLMDTQLWGAVGGSAARGPGSVSSGGMHRSETRRGQRGEHQWMRADRLGHALAATRSTGVEQLPHVPAYSYEHDGQTAARRLPQRISSTRSGSRSVEYATRPPLAVRCSTRPRSRTGREQCPHRVTCSAHRSKSGRLARLTISSTMPDEKPAGLVTGMVAALDTPTAFTPLVGVSGCMSLFPWDR